MYTFVKGGRPKYSWDPKALEMIKKSRVDLRSQPCIQSWHGSPTFPTWNLPRQQRLTMGGVGKLVLYPPLINPTVIFQEHGTTIACFVLSCISSFTGQGNVITAGASRERPLWHGLIHATATFICLRTAIFPPEEEERVMDPGGFDVPQ